MDHSVNQLSLAGALAVDHVYLPQFDQRPVPAKHLVLGRCELTVQSRALEGGRVLRIKNGIIWKTEILELIAAPFTDRLFELRIVIVGEEQEGIALVVFLAHKEQRRLRSQKKQGRNKQARAKGDKHAQPLSPRAVPAHDMVLQTDHACPRGHVPG